MTNIVWKRPDGGVSVTHLTPESIEAGVIPEEHAKELQKRGDIPTEYERVAIEIELPPNRDWREAWTWTTPDPVIDICPVKAAAITKDRLRAERAPLLAALDVQYQRAQEQGADTKEIVAEKNRLRDITKLVDEVKPGDLDTLKGLTCAA